MFRRIGRDNLFLMLALLLWALGEGMWLNLRQILLQELGATPQEIGLALTIESLGRIPPLILVGLLIDRIGPRAIILVGWVLGVVFIALMSIAPTWQTLAVAMALYGSTIFVVPAISAYAIMAAPSGSDPQRTLSLIYIAFPIGQIISPAVGGFLAETFGSIRLLLWLAIIMYGFSTIAVFLTRHIDPHPRETDFHISQLLGNRLFVRYSLYFSAAFIAMYVSFPLLSLFMKNARAMAEDHIGLMFSIMFLGTAALGFLLGRTSRRVMFLLTISTFWLGTVVLWQVKAPNGVAAGSFLMGVIFFLRPSALARLESVIRPHERGAAYSGIEILFAFATLLVPGAAGQLYALTPTHDLPFIVSVVAIPLVIVGWFALRIAPGPEPIPAPAMADGRAEGSQ